MGELKVCRFGVQFVRLTPHKLNTKLHFLQHFRAPFSIGVTQFRENVGLFGRALPAQTNQLLLQLRNFYSMQIATAMQRIFERFFDPIP